MQTPGTMPLEDLHNTSSRIWALWKVEEDEAFLAPIIRPFEQAPDTITNPIKRLEFLAGRVLIKKLLEHWNVDFKGLTKDTFGKPFLNDAPYHISLSHSFPYVAAVIDRHLPVGIDLEQPKEKLLKIAHRVLNESELHDAGADPTKHCVYWCAKEALIKIYGKKDLTLSKNLSIEPFSLQKQGNLIGRIIVNGSSQTISLVYLVYDNFVVALNH